MRTYIEAHIYLLPGEIEQLQSDTTLVESVMVKPFGVQGVHGWLHASREEICDLLFPADIHDKADILLT